MKTQKILITLILVLCAGFLYCNQDTLSMTPTEVVDAIKNAQSFEELMTLQSAIQALLILLGSYIAPFAPGFRKIPDSAYRVLAVAIIVSLGFILFGSASVLSSGMIFTIITSLYDLIFKKMKKTAKPS